MKEDVLTERFDAGAFPARPATAPEGAAFAASAETDASQDALALALASLEDDKAEDVLAIDLRGKSPITDHMIVASGRSARQVTSIAEKLSERYKARFGRSPRIEGKAAGDWALVDLGDVIVHVFRPEVRAFYQIEKMWMEPEELRARAAGSA